MVSSTDPYLNALLEAVAQCPLPAFVLDAPSTRLLAVSPSAHQILDPTGEPVVGRDLEEFLADTPSGALTLLMRGRLDSYETTRELSTDAGSRPLQLSLRSVYDPPFPYLLGILNRPDHPRTPLAPQSADDAAGVVVVGATTPHLIIDRISAEVDELLGLSAERVLGRSLLTLASAGSIRDLLWGLNQTTTARHGVPVRLELLRADGTSVWTQMLLMAVEPHASCAFTILPAPADETAEPSPPAVHALLTLLAAGMDSGEISRRLALRSDRQTPAGLSRLSARELDIVARLVSGDRVPAIAKTLFLATSTVRNNLSSAFAKLGVSTQQQLIDLLRGAGETSR